MTIVKTIARLTFLKSRPLSKSLTTLIITRWKPITRNASQCHKSHGGISPKKLTPQRSTTPSPPLQTFDKHALKTGDSACGQAPVTVTVTSYVAKPAGLVHLARETEVSISRTMIASISRTMVQAGVSVLLTSSSSSSTLTLSAQTTFATSTKASKF
jgi:hypothetical protein